VDTKQVLKDWLKESEFKGNMRQFAISLDIPIKTVQKWVYEGKSPGSENRVKIYLLTQLEEFKPRNRKEEEILQRLSPQLTQGMEKFRKITFREWLDQSNFKGDISILEKVFTKVNRIKQFLNDLTAELDFFKNGPPEYREILKNCLNGPHVAYVSNLIQLMLNEERFQDWLRVTKLTMPIKGVRK